MKYLIFVLTLALATLSACKKDGEAVPYLPALK
jgi:hypothetical protein